MEKFKPITEFDTIEQAVSTLNVINKKINDMTRNIPHLANIQYELNLRVTNHSKPTLYFNVIGKSTIIKAEEL
ncbi:MAG TPA: hypothetical protein VIK84_01230 [Haloplasmataceae bacterium]